MAFCYGGNSVNADQLFIAQKRAIRIIKNASYHAPCKNWFRELGILTLPSIYILEVLKFVKRNGELFELVGEAPHYQTRYRESHSHHIRVERHNTSKFEKSVRHNGGILFNILPDNIKSMDETNFIKHVKEHLLNGAFYSQAEFINSFE
jgi:hypothetical protein